MRREIDKLAINGENPTWVGSKKVLGNDAKVGLGRLVLPGESKLDELLTAEEKEKKKKTVYTMMVDGDGEVWELDFNYWPSLKRYVFKREWAKILKKFGVEAGQSTIALWFFYSSSQELLHVLTVDDSLVDRKVIEQLLKISSCKVIAVDSGTRALQYLGLDGEKNSTVGFNDLKTYLLRLEKQFEQASRDLVLQKQSDEPPNPMRLQRGDMGREQSGEKKRWQFKRSNRGEPCFGINLVQLKLIDESDDI
ncbi:hypothetical protein Syun_019608 [Stephania yunnanensis]|uniref:Uncharacterized protein n=1 Tax=Stephania yunnanensis TaxID=152371 RepID=A0AAP0NZK4_9MAGN